MYNYKQVLTLDAEKLKEIYTSEKFRNEVAYAHGVCTAEMKHLGLKTCAWPTEYWVTEEQKAEALKEIERSKKEKLANLGNKLIFVGMGMDYKPRYEDDVCNHRIRTEFQNPSGRRFFLEVGTWEADKMRVDFAIDRTRQDELKDSHDRQGEFYNYKNLERGSRLTAIPYTFKRLLQFVNENFDCSFSEISVDYYTLRTEDFICISPPSPVFKLTI